MKKTILLGLCLALFATATWAENFNYNMLQVNAHNTEFKANDGVDSLKIDDTGFGVSGTVRLPRNFYLAGSYETVDIEGVDFTNYALGLGAFFEVAEGVDLFTELAHVNEEVEVLGFSEDDNGYAITLGARGLWTPRFEAEARYRYTDMGGDWDPISSVMISGMYKVTDQFGIGLSLRRDNMDDDGVEVDRTVTSLFGRANF